MITKTHSEKLISRNELVNYIHSHLPANTHMTLTLPKDTYTQEEADKILAQALETWEYIKTLRE